MIRRLFHLTSTAAKSFVAFLKVIPTSSPCPTTSMSMDASPAARHRIEYRLFPPLS